MKTTITIQPLTPTQETLTYEQAKARPGIYRAEGYPHRFISLGDEDNEMLFLRFPGPCQVHFAISRSWADDCFIPVHEEITIKFS